jgi:hypothetical protein
MQSILSSRLQQWDANKKEGDWEILLDRQPACSFQMDKLKKDC